MELAEPAFWSHVPMDYDANSNELTVPAEPQQPMRPYFVELVQDMPDDGMQLS